VSIVGDLVVLVGKVIICIICAMTAYYYMITYMREELNGFVLQTVLVAFIAFFVSTMILGIISGIASTMLQATIVEEEIHKYELVVKSASSEASADQQESGVTPVLGTNASQYQYHLEKHRALHDLLITHREQWIDQDSSDDGNSDDEAEFYDELPDEDNRPISTNRTAAVASSSLDFGNTGSGSVQTEQHNALFGATPLRESSVSRSRAAEIEFIAAADMVQQPSTSRSGRSSTRKFGQWSA
jgi:hypothetical protein